MIPFYTIKISQKEQMSVNWVDNVDREVFYINTFKNNSYLVGAW